MANHFDSSSGVRRARPGSTPIRKANAANGNSGQTRRSQNSLRHRCERLSDAVNETDGWQHLGYGDMPTQVIQGTAMAPILAVYPAWSENTANLYAALASSRPDRQGIPEKRPCRDLLYFKSTVPPSHIHVIRGASVRISVPFGLIRCISPTSGQATPHVRCLPRPSLRDRLHTTREWNQTAGWRGTVHRNRGVPPQWSSLRSLVEPRLLTRRPWRLHS